MVRWLVSAPSQLPAQFQPLRPVSRARRVALLMIGPVAWLIALAVLAFIVDRADAVELALAVLFVSFVAGLVLLGWTRYARAREERDR
jgi:membrane protein implicated in regulation of membrane protease activity